MKEEFGVKVIELEMGLMTLRWKLVLLERATKELKGKVDGLEDTEMVAGLLDILEGGVDGCMYELAEVERIVKELKEQVRRQYVF